MFKLGDIVHVPETDVWGIVEMMGEETFCIRYFFKNVNPIHYENVYYKNKPNSHEHWKFIGR